MPAPDGTLDVTDYNAALDGAHPLWESDAALVVLHALGPTEQAQVSVTVELFNGARRTTDSASRAVVTVLHDALADDSVRAMRYHVTAVKDADVGAWRLQAARVEWRCYRGHSDYSTVLCA